MIGLLPAIVIGAGLVWCQQQQPFLQLEDVEETATDFSANPVWRIGEAQTIRWTTTSVGCTISLWQQNLKSGSALEGPPIFHSRSATGPTQFDWTPQIFDFDLSESNVFFLQLRHGNGAPDVPSLRSRYVNLSIALSPPPLRPRALSAPTEVDDSIPTIPPSFTVLTLAPGAPPPTQAPSQKPVAPQPTYIIAGTSSTATPDPLSTGAKVGIGVGAAVGGSHW
ncbi:hypothetical protein PG999_005474 [Apiospora kogelbergensis]|uniref:Uncharacterized protein n=1 Tax=Apiospora kogelbergensis TaxID=1337665 RepID=A0AAW0R2A5_9PEZI